MNDLFVRKGTSSNKKEAIMSDFTVKEYYPKFEIEFDQRFSRVEAGYEYLENIKWPNVYPPV